MESAEKRLGVIKAWLTKSDMREVAGMLGYSYGYVWMILSGKRSYDSPGGEEIMRLALRKARQNKYFRSKEVA